MLKKSTALKIDAPAVLFFAYSYSLVVVHVVIFKEGQSEIVVYDNKR